MKKEVLKMTKIKEPSHRISVKVAETQLKFLENRVNELGLSSTAELLRWFIIREMDKFPIREKKQEKKSGKIKIKSIKRAFRT